MENKFNLERELLAMKILLETLKDEIGDAETIDVIEYFQIVSILDQAKNGIAGNMAIIERNFDIKKKYPNVYGVFRKFVEGDFGEIFARITDTDTFEETEINISNLLTDFIVKSDYVGLTTEIMSSITKLSFVLGNLANAYTASKIFLKPEEFTGSDAEYIKRFDESILVHYDETTIYGFEIDISPDVVEIIDNIFKECGYFEALFIIMHALFMTTIDELLEMIKAKVKNEYENVKNINYLNECTEKGMIEFKE